MLNSAALDSELVALSDAPHWYVGFSGGLDSSVLLYLLQQWCSTNPTAPTLSAIHVNHRMQTAADEWQQHCAAFCRALQVPFIAHAVQVSARGSGEASARAARYCVFEEHLQSGGVLFLGHHLDDQVETFFLRLMRGAGVEGLAAIPRRRTLGAGVLHRPLLDYSRSEIAGYAAAHTLSHVEDPSNNDTGIDRNFLRAQVLPLLGSRWPAYRQAVARASGHMASAARVQAEIPATMHSAMGDPGLLVAPLINAPDAVAAASVRAWLRSQGLQMPDTSALREFLRQLRCAAVDGKPRLSCSEFVLQRYLQEVYLLPDFAAPAPTQTVVLGVGCERRFPGAGRISIARNSSDGFLLAQHEELTIAWRKGGERCFLPGQKHSQSLKKLLQNWAVPPWWRDRVPLIYWQDEIVAVGDLVRCQSSRWATAPQNGKDLWLPCWQRLRQGSSD